jgi:alpha-D-ribose 1-methylphosphonate 5-triphosphate diphosphatase
LEKRSETARRKRKVTWTAYAEDGELYGKAKEIIFKGGLVLTPAGFKKGSLVIRGGYIEAFEEKNLGAPGRELDGDWLIPGLVELHTDNLEKNLMPRPGIFWSDPLSAVEAHDAQLISAGITTVFDSVCVGEPVDKGRRVMLSMSLKALREARGHLRASHLTHLRCEASSPDMDSALDEALGFGSPHLLSLMDHTPGERQWREPKDWLIYRQMEMTEERVARETRILRERRDGCVKGNTQKVARLARERGIPLASHDDADLGHVAEAVALGVTICEFPTTLEAARGASQAGLSVVMGTPNLIRGLSHSGNVKAADVAKAGFLKCLSSDYVPASLASGAFKLWREIGLSAAESFGAVTSFPAEAAGLRDRGKLAPGFRADLARAREIKGRAVIQEVWVKGERVF